MRRILLIALVLLFSAPGGVRAKERSLRFGRFGTVTLYSRSARPARVALFVSGDGGWNLGVVDMARALSSLDALVVGIDITHYLRQLERSRDRCSYPAGDFETLSKFVQKKLDFPHYVEPVLVGYSSGATLVYATLAQSPPNTFLGAISLGFCPDLPLTKPLCRGSGLEWQRGPRGKGYSFLPAAKLPAPWITLQGTIDQVCNPAAAAAYVKQVRDGEIVLLPKVGHGFSVARNWLPQFTQAFVRLTRRETEVQRPQAAGVGDLPLVEVPAAAGSSSETMAVIISGDGGWAGIDRDVGNSLAAQGVPVVGLDSLAYFWTRRTPEGSARDLERILRHYLGLWHKQRVILVGYSLGADVLPFMTARLPAELLARVRLIALLGAGREADFEFHLSDWLGGGSDATSRPILPEVEKLRGTRLLCVYGKEEEDSICRQLDPKQVKVVAMRGAHHFGGNYTAIARMILKEAE